MIIRVVEWMHCTGKYTNAEQNCSLWVLGVHYIDIQRFIDGRPFAGLSFERSVERAAAKLLVNHWSFRPRDDQIENCPATNRQVVRQSVQNFSPFVLVIYTCTMSTSLFVCSLFVCACVFVLYCIAGILWIHCKVRFCAVGEVKAWG